MASFEFGRHIIKSSQIFFQSALSFAFVNIRPVAPGHVLVAPKRVVKRFVGLTHDEVTDLFVSAQKVLSAIEREYSATSCTLAIQDGQDAGQTVEHVHLHIVPRRPGDFKRNDDVYHKIDDSEGSLDVPHQAMRTEQDMKEESSRLSALLGCL